MTEQLKTIVQKLNEPPFSKSYNLINFDSLDNQRLLQELSDVVCIIEGKAPIDIRKEASDETALRVFNSLRIFKYKPPVDSAELQLFRLGVVEGDKQAIYPILEWILPRSDELQQRAYLAKYLVKIEVPADFYQDPEVEQLRMEYEEMMEQFKIVHQIEHEASIDNATSEDIRQDLQSMEQEREQILRRIEKLQRKVNNVPNKNAMLDHASKLRVEREREEEMSIQKQEQRTALNHADQKIQRIQQTLKEIRQQAESLKPEDLIKKLEEENTIHAYMAEEKLPKEIAVKRAKVQELQKVVAMPAIDQKDIDELHKRNDELVDEIGQLTERRDSQHDGGEDKLSVFRHQAAMVERKKEAVAEKLQEARSELQRAEAEVRDKKAQMRDADGNEIVTSIQFKNYVNKLRSKTNVYKKKRAELQDLRAEIGVLARTEEILKGQQDQLRMQLEENGGTLIEEAEDDILGKKDALPARPKTAKPESKDIKELRDMIKNMEDTLEKERLNFAPLIQQLKPLRERYQGMFDDYSTRKQQYDATAASLESGYSRLEQEVQLLRQNVNKCESELYKDEIEQRILTAVMERTETEERGGAEVSFRQMLQNRIEQSEEEGKAMQETESTTEGNHQDAVRQMKLWRDVMKLMECKKRCSQATMLEQQNANRDRWSAGQMRTGGDQDSGSARPPSRRKV